MITNELVFVQNKYGLIALRTNQNLIFLWHIYQFE